MESGRFRSVKSYSSRKGRITRAQKIAMNDLFPKYGIKVQPFEIDFRHVFNREAPVVLEIGFGSSTTILDFAKENLNINYLGVEVYSPAVGNILQHLSRSDIKNVKIIQYDATEVNEKMIPENSLQAVHIFFPDPWPKKRHIKRRLLKTSFLNLLSSKIHEKGYVHISTDCVNYYQFIKKETLESRFIIESSPKAEQIKNLRPVTKFETRGIKLGNKIYDLVLFKSIT